MAFDLESWRADTARWLGKLKGKKTPAEKKRTLSELGATTTLGFCIGAALGPVAIAFETGGGMAAMAAMLGLLGTAGAGALGDAIHRWKTSYRNST